MPDDAAAGVALPVRKRGRPGAEAQAEYEAELERFCIHIEEIASGLDFQVSSRGWAYLLETARDDHERPIRLCTEALPQERLVVVEHLRRGR